MVTQTQAIPYTGPISLLVSQLRSLTGESTNDDAASCLNACLETRSQVRLHPDFEAKLGVFCPVKAEQHHLGLALKCPIN